MSRNSGMLLDGRTLDLKKVANYLLKGDEVRISKNAIETMRRFRNRLEQRLRDGEQIYGITTGFGVLAKKRIEDESEMQELQRNLVRSHAEGKYYTSSPQLRFSRGKW